MPFGDIQDRNAQRAEHTATPALQVGGGVQNQTLEGMGLQTVSSATRTAGALGALAQDIVGSAQAIQKKEAFVEAYANAGAGRSVKELRDEQPVFSTLFGPSATVQGASARALKTATAEFGNEALAMVDSYRDKDPAEFHKMLAGQVGKHLTGDSITDTLITQASAEKVTEIAAVHYKAHAKYVQELNVQTANAAINTEVKTLNLMLAMPKDQQSEEGIAKQRAALKAIVLDNQGQDPIAHQEMVHRNALFGLRSGDDTVYQLVRENYILSDKQDEAALKATDSFMQNNSDVITNTLKAGKLPAPSPRAYGKLEFTEKQRLEQSEGMKEYNIVIERQHALEAAQTIASITTGIKSGETSMENLLPQLVDAHKRFPSYMNEAKMEALLELQGTGNETRVKERGLLNAYHAPERVLDPVDQDAGRRLYKSEVHSKYPNDSAKAEQLIKEDWALGRYGVDKDLANKWEDAFNRPFLSGNKPDPAFDSSWAQFKEYYKANDVLAIKNVSNSVIAARLHNAMIMMDNGLMDEQGAKAQWAIAADLDAREIGRNPVELKKLEAKVSDLTKGGLSRFVPFIETGGLVHNSGQVRHEIQQMAGAIFQYNGVSAESAFEAAGQKYASTHETVAGTSVANGGRPLAEQMGLSEHGHTANEAVRYMLKKQNIPNANFRIINGMAIIVPADSNGVATGARSIEMSLKGIGKLYNAGIIDPARSASDESIGRSSDKRLERIIDAMVDSQLHQGNSGYTRDSARAELNRQDAEAVTAQRDLALFVGAVVKKPKALYDRYELHPKLKSFLTHESSKIRDNFKGLTDLFK